MRAGPVSPIDTYICLMAKRGSLADYPISLVITNNTFVQQWYGEQVVLRTPTLAEADC